MEPAPSEFVEPAVTLDDTLWEELIAMTGGTAGLCYQCGVCTATCPIGSINGRPLSIRSMIRQAQLGLAVDVHDPWSCTACAQCEATCPRGVNIIEVLQALRYLSWERRSSPSGTPSVLWSLYWNNNPWTQPPSQRSEWSKDLELPRFNPDQHELLLYVGCTPSYDRRANKIVRALVKLLRAADVSFGYLGDDEPCCGESALSLGHRPFFEDTINRAAQVFGENGVGRLVTISPHCYDVFKNHWPDSGSAIAPWHYTQYLATLIETGRLVFTGRLDKSVTFHDPCFLARHNGEMVGSRQVLRAIPGLKMAEMIHSGQETLCCGGGGGQMWLETEAEARLGDVRLDEAIHTGASILATACPFCVACMEDSLSARKRPAIQVLDVSEIAAMALEG